MKLLNLFARRKEAEVPEIAENGADKVLFKSEQNSNVRKRYMNFASAQKRAVDAPLYAISSGRSERPQKALYAPQVWSDVYKKSTRARKLQAEGAFSGRSMVEMLGVLAIVGVLSVGAIAGYQKAMYKYRINKTVLIFSDLLQNVAELSTKKWSKGISGRASIVKYGLLPASLCPADYVNIRGEIGLSCKLPLGDIKMSFENLPHLTGGFAISFYEGDIVKSCVDFLSHGWQNMYPPEWKRTDENLQGTRISVDTRYGWRTLWAVKTTVYGGKTDNITLSDIQNACDFCTGKDYCGIYMTINQL